MLGSTIRRIVESLVMTDVLEECQVQNANLFLDKEMRESGLGD